MAAACNQPFAGGCLGEQVGSELFGCNNSNLLITTLRLTGDSGQRCQGFHPPPTSLTSVQQLGSGTASSWQAQHHLLPLGRVHPEGLGPLEGQGGAKVHLALC